MADSEPSDDSSSCSCESNLAHSTDYANNMKRCKTCKIEKTLDCFYKNKSRLQANCKPCYNQKGRDFYAANPIANQNRLEVLKKRTKKLSKTKGTYAWWYRRYWHLKRNAKNRNKEFNLNLEQFKKVSDRTDCFYCGVTFDASRWKVRTIDRVDNDKGYSIDNCVACCLSCNQYKYHLDSKLGGVITKKRDEFLMKKAA